MTKRKNIEFWSESTSRNTKNKFIISPAKLSNWLDSEGYYIIDNFGNNQVIKLKKNVAFLKTPLDVYNDVLKFIKLQGIVQLTDSFGHQGEHLIISKKATLGSLQTLQKSRYRDSKDTVRLFYKNIIVKIQKNSIHLETYKEFKKLNLFIFEKKIIKRNFTKVIRKKSEFAIFLEKATNNKNHLNSVRSSIGYLISSHKNPSVTKAVIFSDILSQLKNSPYGRSGKGLIINAISKIINVVQYNGKATDLTKDKFVFQNIDITTSLIVLQDVSSDFKFESLFSTLTDQISIEKKHQEKILIPYKQSPKIALTTNYPIPQDSDSYRDRKHLVLLNNFFNAFNKPEKYLKTNLFDWKEKEYLKFDYFMTECVQFFLKNGLIDYKDSNQEEAILFSNIPKYFFQILESQFNETDMFYPLKLIAKKFKSNTSDKSVKSREAMKKITFYAEYKNYSIEKRKVNGNTDIKFVKN